VALTALIVESGTDHVVHDYFNQHDEYGEWAHPVVSAARYLPFVIGGSLFAYGKLRNDDETVGASYAVLQASAIELMVNTVLKAITGRRNPDWRHVDNMDSLSRVFRFGFLRGGVYWGWPSGHTAATTAVASALIGYYPHSTVVQAAGYTLIAYIMFGVTANGRGGMHWFSDAVAGALMSYAVGTTVGKYYRTLIDRRSVQPPPILPVSTAELMPVGIRISLPL
jgi:membrane-associated phospholipid phosphatase